MSISFRPALSYSFSELAGFMNRGFTGYFVPMQFTPELLARMVRLDGADLDLSQVMILDEQPIGIALIARRGWSSRLAAMGIAPEGRGQGIGRQAMDHLIAEARKRNDRMFVLEVIEQNTSAVRLYQRVGFQTVRRLVGMTAQAPQAEAPAEQPEEIDVRTVAQMATRYGLSDLPWQLSGETLSQFAPPARGYRLGQAYALIGDPSQARIDLRCLVVAPEARRQNQASQLLAGLFQLFPGKTWGIPAIMPEELALPALERAGFAHNELSQLQMQLALS